MWTEERILLWKTAAGVDLDAAPTALGPTRTPLADGVLDYALLIAERTTG